MTSPAPTRIELIGDRAIVLVWPDGTESRFDATLLRARCPCATCGQETWGADAHTPIKLGESLPLMPAKARPDVTITDVESVGHYAIRISFSDGHATGIFSFGYLKGLEGSGGPAG